MAYGISFAEFSWLRVLLFAGMVLHKVVWEILKKKGQQAGVSKQGAVLRLVKLVKVAFLAGLLVQTLFLEVLPMREHPLAMQIGGFAVFLAGLLLAIAARLQLGKNWSNVEDAHLTLNRAVVDSGIYGFIRHPIYTGDLLLVLGLQLALNSWLVLVVLVLAPVVVRQALAEEKRLEQIIPEYKDYRMRTKRFIPFVV